MPTKVKKEPSGVVPDRLYAYSELAVLSGLSERRIRRMVEDGRLGYVLVGEERGRVIEGQQFLDWKARNRVSPEE
jgi:hypothetical protein